MIHVCDQVNDWSMVFLWCCVSVKQYCCKHCSVFWWFSSSMSSLNCYIKNVFTNMSLCNCTMINIMQIKTLWCIWQAHSVHRLWNNLSLWINKDSELSVGSVITAQPTIAQTGWIIQISICMSQPSSKWMCERILQCPDCLLIWDENRKKDINNII